MPADSTPVTVRGNLAERAFLNVLARPGLSRFVGRCADLRLPGVLLRALIRVYVRVYGVDLAEAADPLTSFASFGEFFVRGLKPGLRPLDPDVESVLAPCDARLQTLERVPEDGRLEQIKGTTYALEALLGSEDAARRYRAGLHATLYLSPAMYHRVHAPVDGRIVSYRYVPGRLYPVNALAVRSVEGLFARNERVIVELESERFGPVAVVFVGATNVGRISLAFAPLATNQGRRGELVPLEQPLAVRRGDELGRFNLGSTVVLLLSDARLVPVATGDGRFVRLGQALWRRTVPSS